MVYTQLAVPPKLTKFYKKQKKESISDTFAQTIDDFIDRAYELDEESLQLLRDFFEDEIFHFVPSYSSIKYAKIENMRFTKEITLCELYDWHMGGERNYAKIVLKFRDRRLYEVKKKGYSSDIFFTKVCLWINTATPFYIILSGKNVKIQ
jgi:hypothetical protein